MVDHRLSDEHEELRATVERFAREVVTPVAAKHDADKTFPYEVVSQMADMGLFGIPSPEQSGGMGGDYFAVCLAIEELARADSSGSFIREAGVGLVSMPIYRGGSDEQRQEWLP